MEARAEGEARKDETANFKLKEPAIIYALGGPGSGKGTQCSMIASRFGFCHINVGDLLQSEYESGSEHGKLISDLKKEGKLVPTAVVIKLLQEAMQSSTIHRFLIDGFPRNKENLTAAEDSMKIEPDFVLFLDCSEREMTRRLLDRNQGRADDNIETIKKRFEVYYECTVPVINYYYSKGKVRRVDAERSIEEVFESIKGFIISELGVEHETSTIHQ